MNKWVILSCFLLWARHGEGGALKCLPEDEACSSELLEQEDQQEIEIRRPVGAEDSPAECLPGSEWVSNCHSCHCSADGAADCVKQAGCEYIGEPIRCKPNTTFERECNTCLCLESGLGLCTVKPCQQIPVSEAPASLKTKASVPQGVTCAPGTNWRNQCNNCICTPQGQSKCTIMECTEKETEPALDCAPHSQWKRDCNMCWCTPSGRAMCTKMGCGVSPPAWNFGNEKEISDSVPETNKLPKDPELEANLANYSEKEKENHITDESLTDVVLKDLEDFDNNDVDIPTEIPESGADEDNESEVVNKDVELLEDLLIHNIEDQRNEGDLTEIHNPKGVNKDLEVLQTAYLDYNNQEATHHVHKRSACKSNQEFQNDCNTCKCSASGQSYTCTQNECMDSDKEDADKNVNKEVEVFMENDGEDHVEKHSVCKPSTTFYNNCNTCHCSDDGTDFTCTSKICPLPEDVEVFHELHAVKSVPKNGTKKVCVENRMFILNCNTCWCNEDGTSYFCTRKVCVQEPSEPVIEEGKPEIQQSLRIIKKECRPDEVFELECNMCRCNADGKSFSCTRRACIEEDSKNATRSRKARATPQEPPKNCIPSQEFRLDCNMCLCDSEGQDFSCTRIDCAAQNNNNGARSKREITSQKVSADCVPGSVFDQGCNVCRCTEDGGHATCTLKRCVPSKENSTISATESSFRCNPGEQFKQSCNDCSCSADGKSVFCTLLVCDEDLTP